MENHLDKRNKKRVKRTFRVRKKLRARPERPRLSVFRSNRNISVQIIDDINRVTIASASSLAKEFKGQKVEPKELARLVGKKIAERAKEKSIERVVFDRGRYKFHGQIAELAGAVREAGLQF